MKKDYLAIELAKIEAEAASFTAGLLATQDTFLRGHALTELLIAHGAPEETRLSVIGHSHSIAPCYIIYCHHENSQPEAVFNALQDSRAPYHIDPSYSDDVRSVRVEGYEGVNLILPAALFLPQQVAA